MKFMRLHDDVGSHIYFTVCFCTPGEGINLARAMALLPPRYRELLLLKFDNGYSEREIAVMCTMTESNVRKTIQRAKKQLELILNG